METTVKERITLFLKSKKISKTEFGRRIGVSSAFVSSMRQSLQPDKIQSIAMEFPDLNMGWLMTGKGEMLRPVQQNENISENNSGVMSNISGNGNKVKNEVASLSSDLIDIIKTKDEQMNRLIAVIERLTNN
ncbi:MAG: XRE family transcriptional regulator [Rikenellaceae bacterium]